MKRYVKSSYNFGIEHEVDSRMRKSLRELVDYIYDNSSLGIDDPRSDYFVENILNDSIVRKHRILLQNAIFDAVDRQMRGA